MQSLPSYNQFAEHLLQHLPVATFVLDAQHQVIVWNSACEKLTGISAVEMVGTTQHWRGFYTEQRPCLADLLLERDFSQLEKFYEKNYSITDSQTLHTENWCKMPDGRRLYLVIDVGVVTDEQGEIIAAVETQRDRTEQRLIMQALTESEARFTALFGSTMDAILVINQDYQITLFNQAAEKIFQCAVDLALGQTVEHFIAPQSHKLFKQLLSFDMSARKKTAWVSEGLFARRANGDEFPIEATFSPLEASGQRLYTLILRDVNDRYLAEQQLNRLQLEKGYLQEVIDNENNLGEIISASPAMHTVFIQARQVAATDAPVLLLGETGTGKELLAKAIHDLSERSSAILVKINCAALPGELIESELFGHEKGAFTGATQQRKGRFELANGGTLFLDELGELSLAAQAKLLRVLQEQEFERVGGNEIVKTDVRIIAATNRNLAEEIAAGRFRADLFYRLNVFPIQVPALRERRSDIPLLARFFLEKYAKKLGKTIYEIDAVSLEHLQNYPWPGNVRELQNVIERAVILATGQTLEIRPLLSLQVNPMSVITRHATLEQVEREHILAVLKETSGVISGTKGAAAILGINPNTLRSRMQKLGIIKNHSSNYSTYVEAKD